MAERLVLIAAGGTGGHLFPAEALASVLDRLGVATALVTDERAHGFVSSFPEDDTYQIPAATPSGRSPLDKLSALVTLGRGVMAARALIKELRPAAVVGFGGYPTVPPMLAASMARVPTIIHEQNAVIGRANRFLAKRMRTIATGFREVKGLPAEFADKQVHVGNPVREIALQASARPYPPALKGGKLRLVVFGGSQGARVMSDIVPVAIERLPGEALRRIVVVQQAREEDLLRVRAQYARMGIEADVQPFFKELPSRIAESHLVIARSGASTVAELAVIGRPSLLVPLPGSLDQDQAANAASLAEIGAATVIPQQEFTPERVRAEILARLSDPEGLTKAAEAAKSAGIPDAAERLAAIVIAAARITLRRAATAEVSS
jgi:UDP-N-acetylglucosamine--N-acetylmuramyl-(pentapeptide) pyrophosphoryl-undecaprenol N-acetylglucosamine transferase